MNRPMRYGIFVNFLVFLCVIYFYVMKSYIGDVVDPWYMRYREPNLKKYQMDMG